MKITSPDGLTMGLIDPHPMVYEFDVDLPAEGLDGFDIGNVGVGFQLWSKAFKKPRAAYTYLPGTQAFKDVMAEYRRRGGDETYFSGNS